MSSLLKAQISVMSQVDFLEKSQMSYAYHVYQSRPRKTQLQRECKIEQPIEIYDGFIGITKTGSAFATVAYEIIQVDQDGKNMTYRGKGDLTKNIGKHFSVILFTPGIPGCEDEETESDEVYYWEYNDQEHLGEMLNSSKNQNEIKVRTKSPISRYRISCQVNRVNRTAFRRALLAYRSVQVEKTTDPANYYKETGRFDKLNESDIYRAILALKATEDVNQPLQEGEYKVFGQCASFNWIPAIPTIIIMAVILFPGLMIWFLRN